MRLKLFLVLLINLVFSLTAFTFTAYADSDLNFALTELNATARLDFGSYRANIRMSYNLPESKIDYLHVSLKMQPSDIFMAAELSILCGKPVDQVVVVYQKHKHRGWGYIAKKLGIKPGSPQFKALKNKANYHSGKIKHKNKNTHRKNKKKLRE